MLILRPYQEEAVCSLFDYWAEKRGNPLVVIPTGGGKSLVLAEFCRRAISLYPDTRILILSHVKELLAQNCAELCRLWPLAPAGIYSAGLKSRDLESQILFAGIQSIYKYAHKVGQVDLVLVDECHLIPPKGYGRYREFLWHLLKINPKIKIAGLTATPYRVGQGMLMDGEGCLFNEICFEVTVRNLIEDKYLCNVISKSGVQKIDLTGVGTKNGDYIQSELAEAVDKDFITKTVVKEIVELGRDRKTWLIFGCSIAHATNLMNEVKEYGIECGFVHGGTPSDERAETIANLKKGTLRACANVGVMTTGINIPTLDMIAVVRPTKSASLFVQIVGRGLRNAPGKEDCLILDFGGCLERFGPIDAIRVNKPKEGIEGTPPVKKCPECGVEVPINCVECECGYVFPEPKHNVESEASEAPVLSSQMLPMWLKVSHVSYHRHEKPGKPPSMRVEYMCGLSRHREWICFEHEGYPRRKAEAWWRKRDVAGNTPATVDQALKIAEWLPSPKQIAVRPDGRFTEIVGAIF